MGQYKSVPKISFEDVQHAQYVKKGYMILHSMSEYEEGALIANTIRAQDEEHLVNKMIQSGLYSVNIIIYGKNSGDESMYEKFQKLTSLGFNNVYVYPGGLFEWLCLQDIYGYENFPTNSQEIDILKYKAEKKFFNSGNNLLEDYR